jgi:hypothetical protein
MRKDVVAGWEAIALKFLDQTGGGPTANGFVLAACCDLQLHPRRREGARLRGRHVFYDATQPIDRQRELIAGCVALWLLRRAGVAATPAAIVTVEVRITGWRRKPLARARRVARLLGVVNLASAAGTHL